MDYSNLREKFTFPERADIPLHKEKLRMAVFKAFRGRCYYTGRKLSINNYHIDHIIPRSKGGPDNYYNYVLCDPDINQRKSDHINEENLPGILYAISTTFAPKIEKKLSSKRAERETAKHQENKLSTRKEQLLEQKKEEQKATRYFNEVVEPGFFQGSLFPQGVNKDYFRKEIEEVKEGKVIIGIGDDIVPTRGDAEAVLGYIYEKRDDIEVEVLYDYKGDPFADQKKIIITPEKIEEITARIERKLSKEKVWDIVDRVLYGCCLWFRPVYQRIICSRAEGKRYERVTYYLSQAYADFLEKE